YHQSADFLTCVEASIAIRGNFRLRNFSMDQRIPRAAAQSSLSVDSQTTDAPGRSPVHGTVWGYRRGCTRSRGCPHWSLGGVTCSEARRRYFRAYHDARRRGDGTPLRHGTSAGYLSGCRVPEQCPRDAEGVTCSEARASYRRDYSRARGIRAREEGVPARSAAEQILRLRVSGLSFREIARRAGVGRSTVLRIVA